MFLTRRAANRQTELFLTRANVEFANNEAQFLAEGNYPTWYQNGQILFEGWGSTGSGLRLTSTDLVNVTSVTQTDGDTAPALSPDGEKVVYMASAGSNWDIYLVNADGSGQERLTINPAKDGLPTWSPDGQAIAFVSNRDGEWAIWAMSPDGSNQQKLFTMAGSPDGIVFGEENNSNGWLEERLSWTP